MGARHLNISGMHKKVKAGLLCYGSVDSVREKPTKRSVKYTTHSKIQ